MNEALFRTVDGKLTVSIDGKSLIELLAEFESPMATHEGSPSIAGQYVWLPADEETQQAYLGDDNTRDDEKEIFLICDCGVPGCWPMLVRVSVDSEKIVWSDFEQPHRSEDSVKSWGYSEFGPFEFEIEKYTASLRAAMEKR